MEPLRVRVNKLTMNDNSSPYGDGYVEARKHIIELKNPEEDLYFLVELHSPSMLLFL